LPIAEDRFEEALHFMAKLEEDYHDPRLFRFHLNPVLVALRSTIELLGHEMEQHGRNDAWTPYRTIYRDDADLAALARTRNITLHQKAIFEGSRVGVGLFRGRRLKLSTMSEVRRDIPSKQILELWQNSPGGRLFLDDERADVGEQYGVWRQYFIKPLSPTDDALVACRKAIIRINDALNDAHRLHGAMPYEVPADMLLSNETIRRVTVLLESDVDPSLIQKWGW